MKEIPGTKIELNHSKIARIRGLDEFAQVLFPGNRLHQRVFLAVFVELKYAKDGFLGSLAPLAKRYEFSERTLETVRAKLRRLGLIDHVSRFNKQYGYREGWILSPRFSRALRCLAGLYGDLRERRDGGQERKDRDIFRYL